jgi:hypothetical protein
MRRSTSSSVHLARLLVSALCTLGALAACTDQQPFGEFRGTIPSSLSPTGVLQAFDCTATVGAPVICRPASGAAGGASAVLIGGQNVYVKLTSSNTAYDSTTQIFQFDVTVENLLNEAMGTPDGIVADPEGIRVFFHSGPTMTSGSGTVEVENADGTDLFTAPNQPYFAYPEILAKNDTSAAKTWRFRVPPTVANFGFTVLVETDVQYLLVINEVLANPGGTITDANGEWFEVYNSGSLGVDLQGLVIADSAAAGRRPYHVIASSIYVPSGGYAVLGNTTNTTLNGGATVDYAYGSALVLANSMDAVKVSRVYGSDTLTLDRATYASAAISAKNGISRELINPSLDNANIDGDNWADASVSAVFGPGGRGTPTAQNSAFVP